jgi:hypothetical protein
MAILLLAAALHAFVGASTQAPHAGDVGAPQVLYIVSEAVQMRVEPDLRSRAIANLRPYDIVGGRELINGWLRVDGATVGAAGESGWIQVAPDNLVTTTLEALKVRMFRVQETKWPDWIKMEVVRGRIRRGFTGNQVRLAPGDPLRKSLRQNGSDVTEEWIYEERRILFSHTSVATIEVLVIPNRSSLIPDR